MISSKEITTEFINIGIKKSRYSWHYQIALGFFAGIFIGLAGIGASIAAATVVNPSIAKLLSALVFPFGLLMIVLTQTELFTSNNLIIISVMEKKNSIIKMVRNLVMVYIGNALGTLFVVALLFFSNTFHFFNNELGQFAIQIAEAKSNVSFMQAVSSGILCNILVCFAVWMSYATKRVGAKLFILYFPIMLFVLCGFEHSIANFYYGPAGIAASIALGVETNVRFFSFFLQNILPVTLGNLIGGVVIVGLGTWGLFLHHNQTKA